MARKRKYVIKSREVVIGWIKHVNLFARSFLPERETLKGFNSISAENRIGIRKAFEHYDELRRKKIPKGEVDVDDWSISVMVDAHIVATEYGIDPLVALLCVAPICGDNEIIIVNR